MIAPTNKRIIRKGKCIMTRVIIESPYESDDPKIVKRNEKYARECMKDSLSRGEAPFLSHLLYTQVLDDNIPEERKQGIQAGIEWLEVAKKVIIYTDYGITLGMEKGIEKAVELKIPLESRCFSKFKGDLPF